MSSTSTTPVTTGNLAVPGADLYYELRGSGPLVALVATPMDARAYEPLAELLADGNTVLTTDPRGIRRSTVEDRERDCTVEIRADDLARLIAHVDAGPAAILGSSGGAVNVLALAQNHPESVHTVIAHEPPLDQVLPDAEHLLARTEDMIETYLGGDTLGAWRIFMEIGNLQMPDEVIEMMFGGERDPQDLADENYQYARMLRPTVYWRPDVERLRSVPVRVVVGIGEDSAGQLCDRASRVLAADLGTEPAMFPGGHIGFTEDVPAFAARLREVLAQS